MTGTRNALLPVEFYEAPEIGQFTSRVLFIDGPSAQDLISSCTL
jgi:hypothetical protein